MSKFAPYDFSSFIFGCEGDSVNLIPYSLYHDPVPMELSKEMIRALEYLIWYVPNINSLQSRKMSLIEKLLYDDFTFNLLRKEMNLTTNDILIEEKIPEEVFRYYRHKICPDCQKVIFTRASEETKTQALLRHTRNAIAHGLFTVVEDMLMAFDFRNLEDAEGGKNCSAILKIRPASLLRALEVIDSELTHEHLAAKAFKEAGYRVLRTKWEDRKLPYDFAIAKGHRRYAVEIKKFDVSEIIEPQEVEEILRKFEHLKDTGLVLILDSGHLTKESKGLLKEREIIILDMDDTESLLQGRDVLKAIEKRLG